MPGSQVTNWTHVLSAVAPALVGQEEAVGAAYARGQAAWPELLVPPAEFVSYLVERLPAGEPRDQLLTRLACEDLYLCCAVRSEVATALDRFERAYLAPLTGAGLRTGLSEDDTREVLQLLRERLLVGAEARLAQYTGQGPLRSWLIICMLREARLYQKRLRRQVPLDGDGLDALVFASPDAAHIQAELQGAFKAAFRTAFESLTPRERTLLRYQILDGMAVHEIARIYRVHRVTVSRWLIDLRNRLEQETRAALAHKLNLRADELESHLRIIRSGLDLSLTRWLREKDPPPES